MENNDITDNGRLQAQSAVAIGAGADATDRVDLEACRVVETIVLDPLVRERRKPVALREPLREPREPDPELVALDGNTLDLTAVEVALALVLDLHLAVRNITAQPFVSSVAYTPPNVLDFHDSLVAGLPSIGNT